MIDLVAMTADAFAEWAPLMWADYRAELLRAGLSEAEADANVAHNRATTMPDGVPGPGQFVFEVHDSGARVGMVWLAERDSEWFVYDIEIDEALRGRGLGRQTMAAVEAWVRSRGGTAISLSVFGFNDVAQRLYLSQGFEVVRVSMMKRLS